MCYFLYLASPLTLSEVRAMLPAGITADLLPAAEQKVLRELHPAARTGARLLIGHCSCNFVIARDSESGGGERHLRSRLFGAGLSRAQVIDALEVHRRSDDRPHADPAVWQSALASFVAEHARNAGPTLYLLRFGHEPLHLRRPGGPPAELPTSAVRAAPAVWLVEDRPVIVHRRG
jgi:hypothetical protein